MAERLHVVGPDELFGAEEYWEFEVEAVPCSPGGNAGSAPGTLEIKSCDSLTELSADHINRSDDPDRPAA